MSMHLWQIPCLLSGATPATDITMDMALAMAKALSLLKIGYCLYIDLSRGVQENNSIWSCESLDLIWTYGVTLEYPVWKKMRCAFLSKIQACKVPSNYCLVGQLFYWSQSETAVSAAAGFPIAYSFSQQWINWHE